MKTPHPAVERPQSRGEEIANSVSHGIGLAAALAGAPVLIVAAARDGTAINVVAAAIFSGTTVLLYLASTLYHAIPRSGAKNVFRTLDHGAIFLLIAGTYTPFTLGVLRGAWGWSLFGVTIMPTCVIVAGVADSSTARAMPKSVTTAWPSERRMFSGLMSRWTMPCRCA